MRRTKHRRRFHTDRIVAARRARFLRESRYYPVEWLSHKLAYGRLDSTDPWDCGHARCGVCHWDDQSRRAREQREWRAQNPSE